MGKGGQLKFAESARGGFVNNTLLVFVSTNTKDYDEEMDTNKFEVWLKISLQKLPEQCAIIMNNARYQSVQIIECQLRQIKRLIGIATE